MRRKKWMAGIGAGVFAVAGGYFAHAHFAENEISRESLLRALPPDASAVIYVDVEAFRRAAILKAITTWGASATGNTTTDPEYREFVKETGFDYEKDLDRIGIAVKNRDGKQNYFALADGKFDRKKMESYLRKKGRSEQTGGREIFHVATADAARTISLEFIAKERIALTDGEDLAAAIASGANEAGHAEWTERFARLAGTPVFALIRQEAAIGGVLSERTPGGFTSPQLARLLNELQWISVAGKPEGDAFRAVFEGECPNEASMRQLADFLNGITLLAEAGLNDAKLRQQINPSEREAYVQLLSSVEVTKLDRGNSKSVRAALVITPEAWAKLSEVATLPSPRPADEKKASGTGNAPPPDVKKNGERKLPARRP
jgi:hypothetical protein